MSSRGDGCPILLMEADRDKVNPDTALEASEIMKQRLENMEMDPDKLALMEQDELTTEQMTGAFFLVSFGFVDFCFVTTSVFFLFFFSVFSVF
jgi:hypothetical protein